LVERLNYQLGESEGEAKKAQGAVLKIVFFGFVFLHVLGNKRSTTIYLLGFLIIIPVLKKNI